MFGFYIIAYSSSYTTFRNTYHYTHTHKLHYIDGNNDEVSMDYRWTLHYALYIGIEPCVGLSDEEKSVGKISQEIPLVFIISLDIT